MAGQTANRCLLRKTEEVIGWKSTRSESTYIFRVLSDFNLIESIATVRPIPACFGKIIRVRPVVFPQGDGTSWLVEAMQKHAKKFLVGAFGGIVLLAGMAMIVLPGPAFIVIPAGLAILATEFEWAQRWLHKAREYFHCKREEMKARRAAKRAAKK